MPTHRDSVPIHAPTSGTIGDTQRVWTASDGYLPGVILEPDGADEWIERHRTWDSESFISQLATCGALCPSPRGPAHGVIEKAAEAGVTDLIVNAMETEPYLAADLRTLVEEPGRIIDATCEIADALGAHQASLALPFRHRRVVRRMESEAVDRHIEIIPLANPYPQCDPVVLVKTLLDREVLPGDSVLDVDAVVLPLSMVRMTAAAIFDGRPITHALMVVAGDAVDHVGTYRVAIGTPVARLAERVGLLTPVAQVISGGPLTGRPLGFQDAVITADTSAILLFSEAPRPEPVPCIHCGWCVEDCPVGLDPSSLIQVESQSTCSDLTLAQLRVCVDCGLCSHVCPSQLPLAASIRRARFRFSRHSQQEAAITV